MPTDAPLPDGLRSRFRPAAGSDKLVVVFSQVRVPDGKFGLERLFAGTRHACLFLNDPANRWYRGLETAIDAAIADAEARARPAEIILYGSSMGAFGALATAARRPAARVFAFAPDFAVGEAGSQSAQAGLAAIDGEPDVAELIARRGAAAATVEVIAGLFDAYDAGVAARLAARPSPGLRLVPIASSHELHDHLYSVNVIRKLIMTFGRDLSREAAGRGLARQVGDWRPYAAFARLGTAMAAGEDVNPTEVAALGLAGNPGVELMTSEACERSGDIGGAIDVLARLAAAIAADAGLASLTKRYLKSVPRRRMRLLEMAGRRDEARAVAAEAAELYPNDADFAAALPHADGPRR